MQPETRYAKSGDVHIAYQVTGDGPVDLVIVPGFISNVQNEWNGENSRRALLRLGTFSRVIRFDKRGTGLSDRVPPSELPPLDQRMDDVRAVMDDVGSERAFLWGSSEGGSMAILFAATYPDRVLGLILYGAYAARKWAPDYPWGLTDEERQRQVVDIGENWGRVTEDLLLRMPGGAGNPEALRRMADGMRTSASPGAAVALVRMNFEIDVRAVLSAVQAPTLVLHRAGDLRVVAGNGRYLAEHIPGARYVELTGDNHPQWAGDVDAMVDEVEELMTGERHAVEPDRVLATMLFTDIVDSTERAASLGDRRWRELLDGHHAAVRREFGRFRGREIHTAGDGFLATFDGPARAARCAVAITQAVRALGLEVRAGVHTGEIELMGDDIGGLAVHIGARVAAEAGPGEVLVSSTVKDLVAGSGIAFEDRGAHTLKGVPGEWRLFAVASV
jgi:class 3 adenylate cyclase